MPEEPENWWDATPDEDKQDDDDSPGPHNGGPPPPPPPPPGQDDTDSPEPIAIRGYQREGDQWVQKGKGEGDVTSKADSAERSDYDKQKIGATALFLLSFIFGDWWWDGSHGLGALINSIESITYMPGSLTGSYEFWTSQEGFNPLDAILITIAWMLWDISTLVFSLGFVLCWRGWSVNNKTEANRILNGKKSYKFLLYFSVALISMDILSYTVWSGLLGVIEWPFDFIEWHFWQGVAILAAIGLNPDNDLWGRFTSQSVKE
jgi:hypothetical protein|tara:strand:- start:1281 stop:2066 length:786 start_codon:yes stop_codon:yes gene_type:complete